MASDPSLHSPRWGWASSIGAEARAGDDDWLGEPMSQFLSDVFALVAVSYVRPQGSVLAGCRTPLG